MELLGQARYARDGHLTMDIYSHVMPALAQEAADRIATTLWT
jgi:hypothetical protein